MRHLVSRVCVYMKDIGIWREQRMQVYISKLYLFRRGRGKNGLFAGDNYGYRVCRRYIYLAGRWGRARGGGGGGCGGCGVVVSGW